jgi:hypothetical protein
MFDPSNYFSVRGNVSSMNLQELNAMVEKNAFVYITSGSIDSLNFNFVADNAKATGNMIFCYHGLNISVKNKNTNDTTAIKEQLLSIIANAAIMDSNPNTGDSVREGIIDYKRDPEKFIFNYVAKAMFTGIKSSLEKKPKKTLIQKIFGK